MSSRVAFHRFSIAVIVATLGVILWGAYVRATGSGAGCGSHWPTCNGVIIPRSPSTQTMIEFTHRLTSGIAFLMVAVQLVWAFRAFPRRHGVRRAAVATFLLMITEALVGAGLVIYEMVAGNPSEFRAPWMAAHLLNTFALLSAMGLCAWRSRALTDSPSGDQPGIPPAYRGWLAGGLAAVVLVATTGAIVALGDTLFPSASLAEGMAQDFHPGAHLFVRLRILHPVLAVLAAVYLLAVTASLAGRDPQGPLRRLAMITAALVIAQIGLGFVNFALLAPIPLQILHLLLADLLWLSLVALAALVREQSTRSAMQAPAPVTPLSQPSGLS